MQTRRRLKAAAASASASTQAAADDESPSQQAPTSPQPVSFSLPTDIDLDTTLLSSLGISVDTQLDSEAVTRILTTLQDTQRSLESTISESERKEVDYEQALQDKDQRLSELEGRLGVLEAVTKEKDELVKERDVLTKQVSELQAGAGERQKEEDEMRKVVGVLGRVREESLKREEELKRLRETLAESREANTKVESRVRELSANEASNNFKISTLTQQLNLVQAELERTQSTLAEKSNEFANSRQSLHAQLSSLQSSHSALTQSHSSLQSSHKSLQSTNASLQNQLSSLQSEKHDLNIKLAEREAEFEREMGMLKRLNGMLEEREREHREIVESVEREGLAVTESVREELKAEREQREQAEDKVRVLSEVVEKMGSGELPPSVASTAASRPDSISSYDLGLAQLSPTIALASKAQKSGKTFTQVYTDYVSLQQSYSQKCQEYDHMERTLSSVLSQIEERAPVLSAQRMEYERLQKESSETTSRLSLLIRERDDVKRELDMVKGQLGKAAKELKLNHEQMGDLGQQVQFLTRQLARRDDPLLPEEDEEIDSQAQPQEDVNEMITSSLVSFRSIPDLQRQNQKLLRITRDLASRLEEEENGIRKEMEKETEEVVREAHEAMMEMADRMEEEKKKWEKVVQGYVRERDMLRAVVEGKRRTVSIGANDIMEGDGGRMSGPEELEEIKRDFEVYRTEVGGDAQKARNELTGAHRKIGELQVLLAKAEARIDYLNDRHKTSVEQSSHISNDLATLTERYQTLLSSHAKLEASSAQTAALLSQSNVDLSILRNERATLTAEKALFSKIKERLEEDNSRLIREQSQLGDLLSKVQMMSAELENRADGERRRLEEVVRSLEGRLGESESRREAELVRELGELRERLGRAESEKKRVDDKLIALEREVEVERQKSRVPEDPRGPATSDSEAGTELRSRLKQLQIDLANAHASAEQFKSISTASENALDSLTKTYDDYKKTMEETIASHEAETGGLRERIEGMQMRIGELEEEMRRAGEDKEKWEADKKVLEGALADLGEGERVGEREKKEVGERVRVAEEKYKQEVILHAEDIKMVEALKRQLGEVERELVVKRGEVEEFLVKERSWGEIKTALENEITEVKERLKGLAEQNATLHRHLEGVSAQAARLSSSAPATEEGGEGELHSVISYLRKEKDIVDVQVELGKRENLRLKALVDELKEKLDGSRKEVESERARLLEATSSTSLATHAELVERTNQANILRESNAMLRAEADMNGRKVKVLEGRVKDLEALVDPLKEEARVLKAEVGAREAEVRRSEERVGELEIRVRTLVGKYGGGEEIEALQKQVDELKKEKTLVETKMGEEVSWLKEVGKKNNALFKKKMEGAGADKEIMEKQIQELKAKMGENEGELIKLKDDLSKVAHERDELVKAQENVAAAAATAVPPAVTTAPTLDEEEKGKLLASRDEALAQFRVESEKVTKLQADLARYVSNSKQFAEKLNAKNAELATVKASLEAATKAVAEATKPTAPPSNPASTNAVADQVAQLEKKHQEEMEKKAKEFEEKLATAAGPAVSPQQEEAQQQITSLTTQLHTLQNQIASHATEVEAAVERGRLESEAKVKVKDGLLVRAKARITALDKAVAELKKLVPEDALGKAQLPAGVGAKPSIGGATPVRKPSLNTTATGSSGGTEANAASAPAPVKSPAPATVPPAPATSTPAPPGAVRGAPRGRGAARAVGRAPRGGATRGGGRGGAAVGNATGVATSGGVALSIAGAAASAAAASAATTGAKRPREEDGGNGEEEGEGKRVKVDALKPEVAKGGPVAIKRPSPSTSGGAAAPS